MKKVNNEGWGINSITVTIELGDSIKLSNTLERLDYYEKLCEEGAKDEVDPDGEVHTVFPQDIANKEGWDPQEEFNNLRKFCKKLCFVKLSDSNVFDDEEANSNDHKKAKKVYE